MRVLGIDPGTACGWALLEQDGRRIASGTWSLAVRYGESAGMRFVRLDKQLREVIALGSVGLVAYEEVARHQGTRAAHVYGGLVAGILLVCEDTETAYLGIPVAHVKQLATGKGNAGKPAMVEAAKARWQITPTEDEADALWIALAGTQHLDTKRRTP